ncbi:hypothetical protein N431DRAFT_234078 [Stipitochalara longipes BDJ]|nr:hypothetical protein N431DRAFT_234078 [Stipitochalara longipes BDJ]
MPTAQASGAGAPPDPPRPPRRRRPLPPGLIGRYGNNAGGSNRERRPEPPRFVGRSGNDEGGSSPGPPEPPSFVGTIAPGAPLSAIELQELDQFIQDNAAWYRNSPPHSSGPGLGRGSAPSANHQFTYTAPSNEAEIQSRFLHGQDASDLIPEEDWNHMNRLAGSIPERFPELDITRQQADSARPFDGAADSAPYLPRERLIANARQGGARGTDRFARVSISQRPSNRALPTTTPRHRRGPASNNLGSQLRQQEVAYYNSRLAEPFDLPPLPPPPDDDPGLPNRLDLSAPSLGDFPARMHDLDREPDREVESYTSRRVRPPRARRELRPGLGAVPEQPSYNLDELHGDAAAIASVLSSAEVLPDVRLSSPPSSWTNGRPLEQSMHGFDDMDLRQDRSYRVPRSMAFRSQGQSQVDPGEGLSSRTRGRSLVQSQPEPLYQPDPFFRSPAPPMSLVFRGQELPLANAFGQERAAASLIGSVPQRHGTSSEMEDVARQSRGRAFNIPFKSDTLIHGRMQLVLDIVFRCFIG